MWFFHFANKVVYWQDKFLKRKRRKPIGKASKGERIIASILDKHNIDYEVQYLFGYYIHIDFAVNSGGNLFFIEYDGRQHYEHVKHFGGYWTFFLQKLRDAVEKRECKDRNIPLLRIKYDVPFKYIENIILRFLYKEDTQNFQIQSYPIVIKPKESIKDCSFRNAIDKRKKRGVSEFIGFLRAYSMGIYDIMDSVSLNIENHNYEPDFVMIKDSIRVDIEIDEPYSLTGHPTHYFINGESIDKNRNTLITESGWYIIRFSENQFYNHTSECIKEIYKLLLEKDVIEKLPDSLNDISDLQTEKCWTITDSYEYIRENYRQSYLGFNPNKLTLKGAIHCIIVIIPFIWRSIFNKRIRQILFPRLWTYIFHTNK